MTNSERWLSVFWLVALLAGCDGAVSEGPDGAVVEDEDAGLVSVDAGAPDDSGAGRDAGGVDAGEAADAGTADAGETHDAGTTVDAGAPDAGASNVTRLPTCDIVPGGCDEVFNASGGLISIVNRTAPGKIFCLRAGDYKGLYLEKVKGSPAAPLLISNCGGKVVFDSTGYSNGIGGTEVQYVRLSGAGDVNSEYGIEQKNANMGLDFDIGITDVEVDHLDLHDNGYMGLGVRSYPRCDGRFHRGNFVQRNTFIHDNRVRNARDGEGFYIGTSHFNSTVGRAYVQTGCPDAGYLEPPLVNAKIYNNVLEDIGRDGIQVGAVTSGMEIYDNVVKRYAKKQDYGHVGGIQINPGSVGEVHGNWIEAMANDVEGTAIQYAGGSTGDVFIHDNVIVGSPTPLLTLGYMITSSNRTVFRNNTVVSSGGKPFYLFCNAALSTTQPHHMDITDNIFVGYDRIGQFLFSDAQGDWYKIFDGNAPKCPINGRVYDNALEAAQHVPGNFYSENVGDAQFVDAGMQNFRLLPTSPALGKGATIR